MDEPSFLLGCGMKWLLLISLALASCTSSTKSEAALRSIYVGRNVDAFFVRHGPPASSHRLNSGGMLYQWEKHGGTVQVGGGAYSTGTYTPNSYGGGGTIRTTTTYSPPVTLHALCQFNIVTDSRGTVQDIKCVRDSLGGWTTSWAHEYFAEERKSVQSKSAPAPSSAPRKRAAASSSRTGTVFLREP